MTDQSTSADQSNPVSTFNYHKRMTPHHNPTFQYISMILHIDIFKISTFCLVSSELYNFYEIVKATCILDVLNLC